MMHNVLAGLAVFSMLFVWSEEQGTSAGETQQQDLRPTNSDTSPSNVPTAEAMLEALQRYRPEKAVIEPVGNRTEKKVDERNKLWPEGTTVVRRPVRLIHEGAWWSIAWTDESGDPPVRVLPNAALEQMVRTTDHGALPIVLEVSGEFAVFRERNYLLVTLVTRSAQGSVDHVETSQKAVDAAANASEPAPTPTDAPVDDILERLRQQEPERKVLPVADSGRASQGGRTRQLFPWAPIPDGTPVSRRPGRIVRQGDSWLFVYESDNAEGPEPPMTLLPNLSVERMVQAAEDEGQAGLVFLLSGEVTAFLGENYLLPRVALRRMDTGNLRQ